MKDLFFSVLTELLNSVFHSKKYKELKAVLSTAGLPPRHSLLLSNRKEVIEAIAYPSSYYECACCKEG